MTQRGAPARVFILDQAIKVIYQSILVLALYFEFAGHNLPGGGFVGGLMAGAAVSLRYVSGGAEAVRTTFRAPSHVILGFGLFLSTSTALVPVLLGGAVLEHGEIEGEVPIFGKVKIVSAVPFDAGVFLVVVGLVLMLFAAFGDDRPVELAGPAESSDPDAGSAAADRAGGAAAGKVGNAAADRAGESVAVDRVAGPTAADHAADFNVADGATDADHAAGSAAADRVADSAADHAADRSVGSVADRAVGRQNAQASS